MKHTREKATKREGMEREGSTARMYSRKGKCEVYIS